MDLEFQQFCENYIQSMNTPYDPNCELAVVMTDLKGRVLATVGGREKKIRCLYGTEQMLQSCSRVLQLNLLLFIRWLLKR